MSSTTKPKSLMGLGSVDKNQLIKQKLKTAKQFKQGGVAYYVDNLRNHWHDDYTSRSWNEFNRDSLFQPNDKVESNHKPTSLETVNKSHEKLSGFTVTTKGYWMLMTSYDANKGDYDFTFQVKVGDDEHGKSRWSFHPASIRKRLVELFDVETYNQWKQVVLADAASLKWIVNEFQPQKDLLWSVCCSPSSERVCKLAGLKVRQGIAFI